MNARQNILTERVDDMPLLRAQRQRRGLPALLDDPFPPHGNWHGLSVGWVRTIWLSSLFSRGEHRLVHVEPWVATRLWTLRRATGHAVERLDCTDDRLAMALRALPDAIRWATCEAALNQPTVRVDALPTARVPVESPSARAYATVSAEGLLPLGQSKEQRPDLPHVKVMPAVLDPLGMPFATEVVSGACADDPLSIPCLRRVQARVGRSGLLDVGDGTMAARETRACIATQGDVSLGPLPQVPLAEGEWHEAIEAVWSGQQTLSPVGRTRHEGEPERIAEGDESQVPLRLQVAGQRQHWRARRLVGRSVPQAQAAETALRARVANAMAQRETVNQRGRGQTRCDAIAA